MHTADETRDHCQFVGDGIEKMVADADDSSYFGNEQMKDFHVPETRKENNERKRKMNLIKQCHCVAMVMSFSVFCHAEMSTNVVNKLFDKGEYVIAAEVLLDEINEEMSRADIDGMVVWIEKLAGKLRVGGGCLKKFVPPDPDDAYEKVRAEQGWWFRIGITFTKIGVAWKNDAQRVIVADRYLDKTPLMSAETAQEELARFDAVKNLTETLDKVVLSRCKIDGKDWNHYINQKKKLSSIKKNIKANRTRFLSYEVVSPYLYEAHCHLFAGISDSAKVSSFNQKCPERVKEYRMKGIKLLANACHNEWLYSCSQDVRDQFIEIQKFMKWNVSEKEYEEFKIITTLSDCNDPNKVRGADAWWK